ncbi:restriction endonuclease subunit S [Aeromonas rivipollensis]|uniref:restriction endonuclease subunit S n=1 Tax=Aeromonas rivipollensis TaxID=948519 RepID=UPI003D1CED0B
MHLLSEFTTKLSEFIVPVAPQGEQKRIVEKLDALLTCIDTAIEHLQENLATSKSLLASALFEKFHQEVNPMPIKDIFNVYNGRAYKKTELLDSGKYKVIRIQNLKGGENYYYSDLELDENKYCENGDLLFSWSGTPGTSFGAFIWNNEKAIYHYHIWKMEPKVKIAPRYAYWVLKDITEEAIANARGVAGMLHITKGTMESFIVSLPSYEAQQKISQELDELALKSEKLQVEISSKIDSLKHLKASILNSAFKGEL